MRCQEVCDRMALFVAWELPPAQSRAVARHIARCASCRLWYREVVDLAEAWHDDREVPDLDLVTPVLKRLPAATGDAARRDERPAAPTTRVPEAPWVPPRRLIVLHYAVAATMVLALFNLGVFQHMGDLAQHGAALSRPVTRLVQILARL